LSAISVIFRRRYDPSRFSSRVAPLDNYQISSLFFKPGRHQDLAVFHTPNVTILVPFSAPRLRGRLVVYDFDSVETRTRLITVGGGLWFHFMELLKVGGCASALLEAYAETLEILRFYAVNTSVGE
jgi:hypothetical protein